MNRRALFIIPPERFNEEELNRPKDILIGGGIQVTVSSTVVGEIIGDYDGVANSVSIYKDEKINDYDLVVVIGGSGTIDHLWGNFELIDYLKEAHANHIMVAGICAGSVAVAETGLLSSRNGTCYPNELMRTKLKELKVNYLEQNIVQYGDIITSNGPDGAIDFGNTLLKLFN